MGFAQIVQDYCAQCENAPSLPVKEPVELPTSNVPKEITYHVRGEKKTIPLPEMKLPKIPQPPSGKELQDHMEGVKAHRKTMRELFDTLSADDRKKLCALARAGQSGGTVKSYYKLNMPFDTAAITATCEQIEKGLAAAQAEGLDLDGSWAE